MPESLLGWFLFGFCAVAWAVTIYLILIEPVRIWLRERHR